MLKFAPVGEILLVRLPKKSLVRAGEPVQAYDQMFVVSQIEVYGCV